MMKRFMILMLGMALVVLPATSALAEEVVKAPSDKKMACDLLGNCAVDMIEAAESMMVECNKMKTKANRLMEYGKAIQKQGKRWEDEEMIKEGQALYDQGKTMWDEAVKMGEACALLKEFGYQKSTKYKKKGKKGSSKSHGGDIY
ncbi:hypothetical protein ACFL4G_01955 [Thermodesulfobacteriota bacterium]